MHIPLWNDISEKQGAYVLITWRFIPVLNYTPCTWIFGGLSTDGTLSHKPVFFRAWCCREAWQHGFFIKWGRQKLGQLMNDPGCTQINVSGGGSTTEDASLLRCCLVKKPEDWDLWCLVRSAWIKSCCPVYAGHTCWACSNSAERTLKHRGALLSLVDSSRQCSAIFSFSPSRHR